MEADFPAYEHRKTIVGALEAFRDGAPRLFGPDFQAAQDSNRRPDSIAVINRVPDGQDQADSRSCNPTATAGTSALAPLTWVTKSFEATIAPFAFEQNYIRAAEALSQDISDKLNNVLADLDALAVAQLVADKAAVQAVGAPYFTDSTFGSYAFGADLKTLYTFIPSLMQALDMNGPFYDIANTFAMPSRIQAGQFGSNNQQNVASSLIGIDSYYTNRIVPSGTPAPDEVHYIVPRGHVGILNWVDWASRQVEAQGRSKIAGEKEWVGTMEMGGFTWGVFKLNTCGDMSTQQTGEERTPIETYSFAADFALASAYSSDADDSAIVQIDATAP